MDATHPDAAAFLAAICANPADDLPRLVYADWLDEHGQVERADFIRVQIQLAQLPDLPYSRREVESMHHLDASSMSPGVAKVFDLRDRERAMLTPKNFRRWGPHGIVKAAYPSLTVCNSTRRMSPLHRAGFAFRRGFVSTCSAPLRILVGGPCGRCRGVGRELGDYEHDIGPCRLCHGVGSTVGILGAVLSAHPVTCVAVTDYAPIEEFVFGHPSTWDQPTGVVYRWESELARLGVCDRDFDTEDDTLSFMSDRLIHLAKYPAT